MGKDLKEGVNYLVDYSGAFKEGVDKEDTIEYYFNCIMTSCYEIDDELTCLRSWLETGDRPSEIEGLGRTTVEFLDTIIRDVASMRTIVSAMRKEL